MYADVWLFIWTVFHVLYHRMLSSYVDLSITWSHLYCVVFLHILSCPIDLM